MQLSRSRKEDKPPVNEYAPKPNGNVERLLTAPEHMKEHGDVIAKALEQTAADVRALAEAVAEECLQTAHAIRENVKLEADRCDAFYKRMKKTIGDVQAVRSSVAATFDLPPAAPPGEPATHAEAAAITAVQAALANLSEGATPQ